LSSGILYIFYFFCFLAEIMQIRRKNTGFDGFTENPPAATAENGFKTPVTRLDAVLLSAVLLLRAPPSLKKRVFTVLLPLPSLF